MRRRFGVGALGAVGLLAAGYTVWWFILSRDVDTDFAAWANARRAEGWTVDTGADHLAFWPLAAGIELSDVRLRGGPPELPVAFTWDAGQVDLQVGPFHPATLSIIPHREQRIGLQNGGALLLDGGTVQASLPVDRGGPPWVVQIEADSVHVRPASGGAAGRLGHLTAHATIDSRAPPTAPALAVTLAARRVELPAGRPWPLGGLIEAVDADLTITGPVPPVGAPELRAREWRRAGGAAELRAFGLHWGPLDAVATGNGGLDPDLQPVADGSARITGWARALDMLAANGVIDDHAALTAKAVVSLLAETPKGGGASVLTMPFAVRSGVLSVREIPLVRVPGLEWPPSPASLRSPTSPASGRGD